MKNASGKSAVGFAGDGWQAMFEITSSHISGMLSNSERWKVASSSMHSVLLDEPLEGPLEYPPVSEKIALEGKVHGGFLALSAMVTSLEECEHYFKAYPFKGRKVSRSDQLRNMCEMYFDRVVQFRDRLKEWMNVVNKIAVDKPIPIKDILKSFDRSFKWEIKNRNFTHHHGRFNNSVIERLSLVNLLSHSIEIEAIVPQIVTYRTEVNIWVKRVKATSASLHQILDMLAGHVATHVHFEGIAKKEEIGASA